ncbi:(Fe-S)-binding protein [archaeon]|jgi:Fe-S oxidoreductase|nr:(Fe-S)-binding protein [archaeon]MBT4397364.1 (Fe-S)-binding protein [archaeon]MBT4440744.1 (Fe-S)-binding protein [archaeon]
MAIFGKLFGKVLYYPGCSSKFVNKDIQRGHEHLLTSFEIDYVKLPDLEVCCGLPALHLGYRDDFQSLYNKNMKMFRNQRIKMIITSCPTCYYMFKKHYPIEVKHISEVILDNIEMLKKDYKGEKITFFDPCNFLGANMLYDQPREILKNVNFDVQELPFNREESLCCGFAVKENSPKIAHHMAQLILKDVKTKKLITTCPNCYMHLKENSEGIEVLELNEVLI